MAKRATKSTNLRTPAEAKMYRAHPSMLRQVVRDADREKVELAVDRAFRAWQQGDCEEPEVLGMYKRVAEACTRLPGKAAKELAEFEEYANRQQDSMYNADRRKRD